ncbi:acetate--CoA ligase family protein [Williamsia soli]|uniref:acetate--CoA ligase family protein n=1 Tax=Williamsia soli TaxID=364929 RepID=UPI001A9DE7BE|nr:acetate--CoA ligase family protein [Williamsia soli]
MPTTTDPGVDVDPVLRQGATTADGRVTIAEHAVKELLRNNGVDVPRGITFTHSPEAAAATRGLTEPLVLKAFGPGLLHKSDVGGVKLGLTRQQIPAAVDDMRAHLTAVGITPDGFLVEEQHAGGIELIVGVVRDSTFGHVLLLGLGGIATELLNLSAVRVVPLSRSDAEELVDTFPGAPLLKGARGTDVIDRDALVNALLAIAGPEGLVNRIGPALSEFECNPVVVTTTGASALDARLLIEKSVVDGNPERTATDFAALFAPSSIAIAGASGSKSTFGNRFLAAYRQVGWTDGLYALHPSAQQIDGVPAYPDFTAMPTVPDYLVVAVPASVTPSVVSQAARAGVRFIHVITGGFAEMGAAGLLLQEQLGSATDGSDARILGPNCLGVYSPRGRQVFTLGAPEEAGAVSVVSQSGGLSGDMITVGAQRGIRYSKLVSIGNAIDVTQADLVDWLVDDPDTEVIGIYLEGARDGVRLRNALRRADGVKPVVMLRGGASEQGSTAVSSHTGSMASSSKVWDAVSSSTGTHQVPSLETFLSCLTYLQQYRHAQQAVSSSGVLVIGLGGGASVLATDACDRAGLAVTPLHEGLKASLRERGFGAGTSVANPLEVPVGPTSSPSILADVLRVVLVDTEQSYADVLIHLNVAAYYNYGTAGVVPLIESLRAVIDARFGVRIAVVLRNSDVAPAADGEMLIDFIRSGRLPVFRSFDEATAAIASAQNFDDRRL